jgi:hypothetical protein
MNKRIKNTEGLISSKNIEDINHALIVLRHFVELSAKLLPFLVQINKKERPTRLEFFDKKRIIDVYKEYDFDNETTSILLDSPILDFIKVSFDKLVEKEDATFEIGLFQKEFERLRKNLEIIKAN